jgi:hypothetical protein
MELMVELLFNLRAEKCRQSCCYPVPSTNEATYDDEKFKIIRGKYLILETMLD